MKKIVLLTSSLLLTSAAMLAQSAFDAYSLSRPDMKGTARFMSMGGAFGALGGDLTTFSYNPAGIGIYRGSEIGITGEINAQQSKATSQGVSMVENHTKFLFNNIGGVTTIRLNSYTCPNINLGFTYNRTATFDRKTTGTIPMLRTSLSNYIAGIAQAEGATETDLNPTNTYNPYNPTDGGYAPNWISILGYTGWLISPEGKQEAPNWVGQYGNGTTGSGSFSLYEKGGIDEYNIALGGNFANVVYWGMDFGITSLTYRADTDWSESLQNAYVNNRPGVDADWDLYNYYKVSGTGFNYKFGLIIKPIQEFRLGFAIHTPTWYNLDESFYGAIPYKYSANSGIEKPDNSAETNGGYDGENSYNFRSPWKFMVSAAGVIGNRFILSADYEWTSYSSMHYSYDNGWDWGWDDPYDWDYFAPKKEQTRSPYMSDYDYTNKDIKEYFTNTSTLRVGAEFRVTPQFSVRAGYSYVSSPFKEKVRDNQAEIYTTGTRPQYVTDNSTSYITAGLGYRYQKFYIDAAYVYKHRTSTFHAFAPDLGSNIPSPEASISDRDSQVVISMGFKF